MGKIRYCLSFFFFAFGIHSLMAQYSSEITLKVEPDTNFMRIGEQINLTISMKHPENMHIEIPFLDKILDPKLEVLEISDIDTVTRKNNAVKIEQKYLITSFDTGYYEIPRLPFEVSIASKKDTLFSYPVPLMVFTLELDTTNNIFDIKPQYEMPFKISEILDQSGILFIPLAFLLIGLATLIYVSYFRTKDEKNTTQKPIIPAHIIAIKELDQLKSEKLWQQNKIKEYYTRLTNIIRHYIELRFNVMALEKTSSEIISEFDDLRIIDENILNHLKDLLSLADLIKFAKGTALPDENEKNMESAYDFVRKTKMSQALLDSKEVDDNDKEKKDVKPDKSME